MSGNPQKYSDRLISKITNRNKIIFGIVNFAFCTSIAYAGTMGEMLSSQSHHPLIALSAGYASVHAGHSQSYLGTNNDLFAYYSDGNIKNTGLVGVFLGEEFTQLKFSPLFFLQTGIEYTYLGNNHLHGSNTVGIQPNTSTLYHYDYTFESQQLLAVVKVLATTHQIFHPYFSAGIGAAFNHSGKYAAHTFETGSINITPTFHYNTQSEFSYELGIGVDTTLNEHLRLGLGYRYTDMGRASSENGKVVMSNYSFSTDFSLVTPHVYANQIVAQISYLA